MSTTFASLPSAAAVRPASGQLIQLMSTSLRVVPLSTSPILVMGCLEVGTVVLIMAELVAL